MKKLVLLLLLFVFISCDNNEMETDNEINVLKVDNLIQLENDDDQRVAFRLLSSNEMAYVWKRKLEILVNENRFNTENKTLNNKQIALIEELIPYVTKDFYDQDKKEYIRTYFLNDWLKRAKASFEKEEMASIFDSLKNPQDTANSNFPIGEISNELGSKCKCNRSEDYCLIYVSNCERDDDCEQTTVGCGILWGSACNGTCV